MIDISDLSKIRKGVTQIYGGLYSDAMLVPFGGAPTLPIETDR